MTRWPTVVACFLGGCSFLGLHFIPAWLRVAWFLPAAGPLLLLAVGVLAMGRARAASGVPRSRPLLLSLAAAAILLVPMAVLDMLLFVPVPYVGVLIGLIAFPFHLLCVGIFGGGIAALRRADATARTSRLALAAVTGLAAGILLTVVRFQIVPRSRGVFLEAFSESGAALKLPGSPLDPHGQQDIAETLGVQPRRHHEPIVAMDDQGLWTARQSADPDCRGYWIERRALAAGGRAWRRCLPTGPVPTRNPTSMAAAPSGGLFVAGFDVLDGTESAWIKRYDVSGVEDTRWGKSFGTATKIDRAYGIQPSPDGSMYVVGETGEIDARGTVGWVRKFDASGREIREGWPQWFPNAGERRPTMATIAAATDSAETLYVLLDLYGSHSVRRLDAHGRELWERELPHHQDLVISAAGNDLFIFGAAGYPGQAWLEKVNGDGSQAWERQFAEGHLSGALAMAVDPKGQIYVAGYGTERSDKASYWWIKKLGTDGQSEAWHATLRGPRNDNIPFQLRVNSAGEIHVIGKGNGWQFSGSWLERWWGW